jgi:hypothetical protein
MGVKISSFLRPVAGAMKMCGYIAAVLLCFFAAQQLLVPKYMSDVYEGAMIAEYYGSEKNHSVLFIGDCEVYENFSPVALWREFGMPSYIRGGAQQLVWQSYYLLEDTLRYEKPDVVVFNVLAMKYDTPQNEAYNRLNLDGMRLSASKLKAVSVSMLPNESLSSYIFPLLRFHERWNELSADDLHYYFQRDNVSHNGYYMRNDVKATKLIPEGRPLPDYNFGANSYAYLDKITALCADEGIDLVLVKAPTIYPHWYPQWDAQMEDYAAEHGLLYINFLGLMEETGIDLTVDSYDAGLHLNLSGAEKLTSYLGGILKNEFALGDRRGDEALAAAWREKELAYDRMKTDQLLEIEEFGEIRTFTY